MNKAHKKRWGGYRPGAGRPRNRLVLYLDKETIEVIKIMARSEGVTLECKAEGTLEASFGTDKAKEHAEKILAKEREEDEGFME